MALESAVSQALDIHLAVGAESSRNVGSHAVALVGKGASALLVCDPFIARNGLAAGAMESLADAGFDFETFIDIQSDPLAAQVDRAAEQARRMGARVIVGIGGGSALDVAKLAAATAAGDAPSSTYACMDRPIPDGTLPIIAVPTTAGTGSEVTRTTVYTLDSGAKVWAWGEALRPKVAVLDPILTMGLPPFLTAATGIDAMVHAIEACTNNRRPNPAADSWAHEAIALVAEWLPKALAQPDDLKAREALQRAAFLAGAAIDACGTAIAHALGHALGAIGHIHHGRAVGLCLRVALPGNIAAAPDRHAAVAQAMGASLETLAEAYDAFLRASGIEVGLEKDGLGAADLRRLTEATLEPANRPMIEPNCRQLSDRDVADLAEALLRAA